MYLPDLKQPIGAMTGTGTVLLVDDNDSFRKVICTFLQSNGYTVLQARTASEAVQIAHKHNGTIDLLLTDVVLPGASGDQLSDYLRFLLPKITVIYMSGFGGAVQFAGVGSSVGARMLPKPFSKKTLLLAVGELLHWKEQTTDMAVPRRSWGGVASLTPSLA